MSFQAKKTWLMNGEAERKPSLTIETLEKMFLYLGCANIETSKAMDGAVPIECLLSFTGERAIAELSMDKFESMPSRWHSKAVMMLGDKLALATASSIHWSVFSHIMNQSCVPGKALGEVSQASVAKYLDSTDAVVELFYSEIDPYGKFVKFKVNQRWRDGLLVKRIYNPSWLCRFAGEHMRIIRSDSDELYDQAKISFLAPFLCGLEQCKAAYWQVLTKFDAVCPKLTLLTDPTGVKEFWKLRDIPAGKKRRDALLHWVNDHWRQCRHDPDVETYVRKHLRGADELKHGQFEAKIIPGDADKLEEHLAKQDRMNMRKKQLDRRTRNKKLESVMRQKSCKVPQ